MSKAAELAALISSQSALSDRNMIINGSMAVSQRGTSSTGQGASDLFLVDRFHLNTNGNSAGRFTVTQESDGPSGIPNSLKLACTTADTSIAASERFFIEQRLEGQNLQRIKKGTSDAQAITVSFYVKGNASATYVLGIYDSDNSRQIGAQFSVTTSWNRVSVTFPGDTGGSALDDDNAESLSLRFYLHAGSTYTGGTLQTTWDTAVNNEQVGSGTTSIFDSTSRTFFLTGVQMELGEVATPFEHRSFADELARCERYTTVYPPADVTAEFKYAIPQSSNVCDVDNRPEVTIFYPEKRADPTITHIGNTTSDWRVGLANNTNLTPTGISQAVGNSRRGSVFFITVSSGVSTNSLSGVACYFYSNGGRIVVDAEL